MINFLKYQSIAAIFSVAMIFTFIGIFAYKKITTGQAFTYSVEFTGGTQVLFSFENPVTSNQVVGILEKNNYPGALTRQFGPKEILVRVKEFSDNITGLAETLRATLQEALAMNVKVLQTDSIGQGVGEALTWSSIKAVLFGLFLMLLYIGWRFWSFSFALGAVISLFHDAIAILLFFLLFNKEISINVIGAILAVLGYSINDTIVIFTQIRKNFKEMRGKPIDQIVNISLNQTLRRTILTSFSTTLIVIALLLLGGETLRDLSTALLIGIIFGTYSSIYIASPVMLLFYKEK
jgi:preprotein translocase subunit SecF